MLTVEPEELVVPNQRDRVLVTGGSSGIGRAAAERFRAAGADVTVLDIKPPPAGEFNYVPCDLSDPGSIDRALAELGGEWDAVAHVAGIPGTAPADLVLAVNFLGLRKFVTGIVGSVRRGGSVTVVASTAGTMWSARQAELAGLLATDSFEDGVVWYAAHPADYPPYNLSKEAAIAFVKVLSAQAWSTHGVRLNTVSPGPTETPILTEFEASMGKDLLDGVRASVGRHATVADIAPVIEFLAGPGAGWVIGQDIQVDGGFVAGLTASALYPAPQAP